MAGVIFSGGSTLTSNTISGNTANTGGGIYFESSGSCTVRDNVITGNFTTSPNQTGGIYLSGSPNVNLAGDPVHGIFNRIHDNDGCDIRNTMGFAANGSNDINARNVWWGTCDGNVIQNEICDFFDDPSRAFVLFFPWADCAGGNDDPTCDDCNGNGVGDLCDVTNGTSPDPDGNGVPDECDTAPIIVTGSRLPSGTVGDSYLVQLTAQGGAAPYSWAIVSGALPAGLTIGGSTGRISGTPLEAGDFAFRVRVIGSNGLGSQKDFTLAVAPVPGTLLVTPSDGLESSGHHVFGPFTPSQKIYTLRNIGTTPIAWSASTGEPWLDVSPADGILGPGAQTTAMVSLVHGAAASLPPGAVQDTILFTNNTNGRGNTARDAALTVLRAQPNPGHDPQGGNEVTLNHLWVWDRKAGHFVRPENDTVTIDPAQPTYLLTHGWDGTLDGVGVGLPCGNEHYALSSLACAIREIDEDANLLAWEWHDGANPNERCDIPDQVIAEGAVLADRLRQIPAPLTWKIAAGLGGAGLIASQVLIDARRSSLNTGPEGIKLGDALAPFLKTESLGTELHFIGKSHGGGVLGAAAARLSTLRYPPDSLTTLDTPRVWCTEPCCLPLVGCISERCFVNSLKHVAPPSVAPGGHVAVFHYEDAVFGFGAPVSGNHANLTNLALNKELVPEFNLSNLLDFRWAAHLWISGLDGGECEPDDGWFPSGLRAGPPSFDGETPVALLLDVLHFPQGCFAEGAVPYQFEFQSSQCDPMRRADIADSDVPGLSLIAYEPFQTGASWSGNLTQLVVGADPEDAGNRVILMQEQGDASFFKDIAWPDDALEITFDYMFREPRGGETLTVYLNDEIVYYDNAEISLASTRLTSSGAIYVGHAAGTTTRLNFVLRTDQPDGGSFGGELVIDNIRVFGFVEGDAELDGDVDLLDFSVLQNCFGAASTRGEAPGDTLPPECWPFDLDESGSVSLPDFGAFAVGFTGPSPPPAP